MSLEIPVQRSNLALSIPARTWVTPQASSFCLPARYFIKLPAPYPLHIAGIPCCNDDT